MKTVLKITEEELTNVARLSGNYFPGLSAIVVFRDPEQVGLVQMGFINKNFPTVTLEDYRRAVELARPFLHAHGIKAARVFPAHDYETDAEVFLSEVPTPGFKILKDLELPTGITPEAWVFRLPEPTLADNTASRSAALAPSAA